MLFLEELMLTSQGEINRKKKKQLKKKTPYAKVRELCKSSRMGIARMR
jgi:hypothetical protein